MLYTQITCVRALLKNDLLAKQSLIFDALHTQYQTLTTIEKASGIYIAQIKESQKRIVRGFERSFVYLKTL